MFDLNFISAGYEYSTYEKHIPAPYIRKGFEVKENIRKASVTICGLGFYELFINGKRITKGALAPYISNPDDILYYDSYDITDILHTGENVIGIILGNGMQNSVGGFVWDFQLARFRSAPKVALSLEIQTRSGEDIVINADETFRTHPSPILFDDLRCGEIYDARKEISQWNMPGFDDTDWSFATRSETPRGEARLCTAEPIKVSRVLKPVSVKPGKISKLPNIRPGLPDMPLEDSQMSGYLYDFGVNTAGNITLKIKGKKGQRVSMQFGEWLAEDGGLDLRCMSFQPHALGHRVYYTLKGTDEEIYTPTFTYQGFRYCLVSGITKEQAVPELLTYNVMHSDLKKNGDFHCSDDTANKLQKATVESDLSNFFYFPTDCPHREKNGWTGDAALSAEQLLFNLTSENSLRVWLDNIRKSQTEKGELPGIIPTAGWGYEWGNGPAWDRVIIYLPYYIWKYRGCTEVIGENSHAIVSYLDYLSTQRDKCGLVHIGLGDWVPIGRDCGSPKSPLAVTDTLVSMDMCLKAETIFRAVNMNIQADFARGLFEELKKSARMYLIEGDRKTVMGRCQTSQAMGIYYGLFEDSEKPAAFSVLLEIMNESNWKLDLGCLGTRILFHVLSDFGYTEKAYEMIVDTDYPSYGHWVEKEDATTLFENFQLHDESPNSKNHHFFGDISSWFFKNITGVKINPYDRDVNETEISPSFPERLNYASGYQDTPDGKTEVKWERTENGNIILSVNVSGKTYGYIRLPKDYEDIKNGFSVLELKSGVYELKKI